MELSLLTSNLSKINWIDLPWLDFTKTVKTIVNDYYGGFTDQERKRKLHHYLDLKGTKDFVEQMKENFGVKESEIYERQTTKIVTGNPLLVMQYAQWKSPRIALTCSQLLCCLLNSNVRGV